MNIGFFPPLNASLNGIAGVILFFGWRAIKAKKTDEHKRLMLSALLASAVFLGCYLTYHYLKHGIVTHYQKQGILRVIYFFILITHTPLAAAIVPVSLVAVGFALKGNYAAHVKVTRWLFPVWMYVSVTGVLIYLMLYVF